MAKKFKPMYMYMYNYGKLATKNDQKVQNYEIKNRKISATKIHVDMYKINILNIVYMHLAHV